jgi:peroxiredoxin
MNRKRRVSFVLRVFVLLVCIATPKLFAGEMTPLSGIPIIEEIKPLSVGDKVPYFAVDDIEGKEFDINKKLGKSGYLFVFWSIFCEPCKEEMPLLKLLTDKYKKDQISVVAVNLDGEPFKNAIKAFAKEKGFDFTFIIDELDEEEFFKIADPYGVAGTPTVYVIDKKGVVQFAEVGKVKRSTLEKAIAGVVE